MTYLTPELAAIADGIRNNTMPDCEPTYLDVHEPDHDNWITDGEAELMQRRYETWHTSVWGPS